MCSKCKKVVKKSALIPTDINIREIVLLAGETKDVLDDFMEQYQSLLNEIEKYDFEKYDYDGSHDDVGDFDDCEEEDDDEDEDDESLYVSSDAVGEMLEKASSCSCGCGCKKVELLEDDDDDDDDEEEDEDDDEDDGDDDKDEEDIPCWKFAVTAFSPNRKKVKKLEKYLKDSIKGNDMCPTNEIIEPWSEKDENSGKMMHKCFFGFHFDNFEDANEILRVCSIFCMSDDVSVEFMSIMFE